MPTLEESKERFELGHKAYRERPDIPLEFLTVMRADGAFAPRPGDDPDFRDGWRSAQREAEVERHIDEGKA